MTLREVFLKAAEYLETHGWQQGMEHGFGGRALGYWRDRPACLMGAVYSVHPSLGEDEEFFGLSLDTLDKFLACNPIQWNDAPGRTKEEVVKALRDAAEVAQ